METDPDEYAPVEYLRRLTSKGRRILWKAEVEAVTVGSPAVGPGHILLAILRSPQTAAARILEETKVDVASLREAITESLESGAERRPGRRALSVQGRNVLRAAALEAERTGVRFIGTEHLLLGVLANAGELGATTLAEAGLDFRGVRKRIEAAYRPGRQSSPSRRRGRGGRRRESASLLDKHGRDFTALAVAGELDPVIGRQPEMDRAIEILMRRGKNNPVLVGDAGVGKTAIVEGLAQRVSSGDVPDALRGVRIVALNLASLIAGTKYRGEFEGRVQGIIDEVRSDPNVILFIDEVHTIVGAGGASGSLDAANMLKGHLARGEIRVIGATTWREYRRYVANDKSLVRRFQPIDVAEPRDDDAIAIVEVLRPVYESYHGVEILDEALEASVRMSRRYLSGRQLPDKAIDLIDEAAARAKVIRLTAPDRIRQLERSLRDRAGERAALDSDTDSARVLELANAESQLREELRDERRAWRDEIEAQTPRVGAPEIANVLSRWSGVPMPILVEAESRRFLSVESELRKRIVGQDDALAELGRSLRRAMAGMRDELHPIGSFLLLGEPGVGKTETAKALAQFVSGAEESLVRIDMTEFSEWHTVSRLIGSPPGYVGHDDAGELTERVRRNPFSIVLFDDVEKAHPRSLQILLQIMEDGILTDGSGRRVDFRNAIILMTSNLGADQIRGPKIGFDTHAANARAHAAFEARMREHARRHLPAEFLNRVDRVLVFRALEEEGIREIARRALSDVTVRVEEMGVALRITAEALEFIVQAAFGRNFGARPVRQLVTRYVDEPLTDAVVGAEMAGQTFELQMSDGVPALVRLETASIDDAQPAPPR